MMRTLLWILLILMGGVVVVAALATNRNYQVNAAFAALGEAGYGERVLGTRFSRSRCRIGEAMFTFIAQGGKRAKPDGLENTGYICVGYFTKPSIHEVTMNREDLPDWEPLD